MQQSSKLIIPQLVRALSTSSAASGSVSTSVKPSSPGLISLLGFGSSRISTPLSEPLAGVPQPVRGGSAPAPAKLETSTLAEGVKLATINNASPVATVAVVVAGGSSAETIETAGASKVLEAVAFKATKDRTTFRLTRELEKIGAIAYAAAGRDNVTFAIDAVKLNVPEATEILLDSVLNAKLSYHEVRDNVEIVKGVLAETLADPEYMLREVLHRVAYDGPLGQPLLVDPSSLDDFTHETLREYYSAIMQPANITLASVGVSHDLLKGLAQPLVAAAPLATGGPAPQASKYIGGSSNIIANSPLTHVALAFEAKGGLADAKASALAAVTRALLDDTRPTLPYKDADIPQSISAFAHLYKGSGLVGVTASSVPQQASQLIDAVFKKVATVASSVSDAQLVQAKQVAIGAYKSSLASASTAVPLITSQLSATGKFDAAEYASTVSSITSAQVSAYIKDLIKCPPTLVTYGGLAHLPRYDAVAKRLA